MESNKVFFFVAQVVFGHDMDFSISRTAEHLEDANFEGAAGRRRGKAKHTWQLWACWL